ncbi:hypothetical protein VTO42DRAFT_419 [Malbranchea cinnamomea]
MRLALIGLPSSRSQACHSAQFFQLSPLELVQPVPKRRRFLSCSRTSSDRRDRRGNRTPSLEIRPPSPAASGVVAKPAQLNRNFKNGIGPAHQALKSFSNVPREKTPVELGPVVRYTLARGTDIPLRKWQLSVQQLEIESDVGHCREIGSKLVDDARLARDFNLWRELLLYRQRHYGDGGTLDIWKGMRERCSGVDLPVAGDIGLLFWKSFVQLGLKRESFLVELKDYAQDAWARRGRKWHGFYGAVVGGYLERGSVRKALKWHWLLKDTHLTQPNDILRVFKPAMRSKNGMKAFRAICRTVDGHKIYSSVIPELWQRHMVNDALSMHRLLVQRGDGPQAVEEVEPLIQHIRTYGSKREKSKFLQEMIESGTASKDHWLKLLGQGTVGSDGDTAKDVKDASTRDCSQTATDTHGQQTRFTDEFGARLFATKSFSFELIVAGMQMFSVKTIGPLTLRQMALRARDVNEIAQQIQALQKIGISIGNSVFSRVVQKLVEQGDHRTLQDVLQSDQHPDVLEDLETQELLLSSYTLSQDWRQANKTYAILSVLSDEDPYNLNVQFRNAVNTRRWSTMTELIDQMKDKGIVPSQRSIARVTRMVLPPRRPGRRPQQSRTWLKALWHLLGTLQHIAKCGGEVPPRSWKEGLKRLGMTGRWTELERLCLWLADFYSSPRWHCHASASAIVNRVHGSGDGQPSQLTTAQTRSALSTIFSLPLLQGIIAWGFTILPAVLRKTSPVINPWSTTGETLIPWVRGLILLRRLKEKGVVIHDAAVQKACRHRLAVLYGKYRRSNRKKNRALRRGNPYKLEELLADMDKAWGRPLFANFRGTLFELVNPRIRTPHRKSGQPRLADH